MNRLVSPAVAAGMSRRGFVCLMGASSALAPLALAGCGSNDAAQTGDKPADGGLEKLTFVLDYTPNTNHTGIYVAIKNGYYKDEGLEVEVVQPSDDGADALVGTGQAQLGMSYQDNMANYLGSDDPFPVTAVAAVIQHNTAGIMGRKGEGLTRPAALEGKRYGSLDWDVETAMIKTLVEGDGGDFSKVQMMPANSTDEVSGLRADQFDAIMVFEGWAGQNAKLQDYPVDYFSFISQDPVFDYYTPVIIANDEFLKTQPDTVKRFLAATAKGYEFASKNPKDAASILVEAAPEVDPDLALASQEYLADKYTADAPYWGYIDKNRWSAFYDWMNEEGLTPVKIDAGAGFTNDYLPGSQE